MLETIAKVLYSAVALGSIYWVWTHQIDPLATVGRWVKGKVQPEFFATRDPNKLYQDGQPVADVAGPVRELGSRVASQA